MTWPARSPTSTGALTDGLAAHESIEAGYRAGLAHIPDCRTEATGSDRRPWLASTKVRSEGP